MGERHSTRERASDDWYVEPAWCVEKLFKLVQFHGAIHDPCCGGGVIPLTARNFGYHASGTDKVQRSKLFKVVDFFDEDRIFPNIVTNPPYKIAQKIIERALTRVDGRVAALVQTKFLASQGRYKLFTSMHMERIIIFSRRPSMPPGEMLAKHGEAIRGGGSIDYCWMIWNVQKRNQKPPTVEWTI